jgi:NTP pyrophosphatase (non-canonical NTP hydrolase)
MEKLSLKKNPTLADLQKYTAQMVIERGFQNETAPELFMLFLEECGELAKAARKYQNLHSDKNSKQFNIEEEAADVLSYLLDICNHYKIDLEKAFRDKEEINKKRVWGKS